MEHIPNKHDNLLAEAAHISQRIKVVEEKYKETVTEEELSQFKGTILKTLDEVKGSNNSPVSYIRISCIDKVWSTSDFRKFISDILKLDFQEENIEGWTVLYKDEIFIDFYGDSIKMSKISNRNNDGLLILTKDVILDRLIAEFNAENICLNTTLENGFQNWEFFECENYVKPLESKFSKLNKFLASFSKR